jgi:acyl-CoA reductase-like NAD-dependent aldehyde dehydrogenase
MRLETIRKSTVVRNLSKHNCQVIKENNLPEGISCLINGDYKVGEMMTNDKRVPLISATGSILSGKSLHKL